MKHRAALLVSRILNPRGWAFGLFWSWNIIFVAFMLLGFVPQLFPSTVDALRLGTIPVLFVVLAVILAAIPVAAVIIGFTMLRRSPGRLLALGYGIEGPLMFMLAFRFFILREANAGVAALMGLTVLGMAVLLWQLLDRQIDGRRSWTAYVRVTGLTLFIFAVLYASVWIALYVVPLSIELVKSLAQVLGSLWQSLLNFNWGDLTKISWGMVPFAVLGLFLLFYTATLFVGAPVALPAIALWAWSRAARTLAARRGARSVAALTTLVLLACAVLTVRANQQPQAQAFALLKNPPANMEQAQALQNQEETIRAGLLNAYLASFRYISAVGEVQVVSNMYASAMGLAKDQTTELEQFHDLIARPLLYEPANPPKSGEQDGRAFRDEPVEAAKLYQMLFDQRIVDGEKETIVNTVRSTWQASQAEAAWQAVDDREVLVTRQEINITEKGDWAEVELYEVYQNQTAQRQEVVYYFSLPESAVITGLWLGSSANRADRFAYRVSPRGAAQAVYRNEVRRNMDPALVEQIGPRQYRLRAFPVEPKRWVPTTGTESRIIEEGPPLHLWLTFRVLANGNAWTMPRLAEKRNVYWDATSARLVNGRPANLGAQDWLPLSVTATSTITPVPHRIDFPGGTTVFARPMSPNDLPKLAGNLRLAIVLDRSRSMGPHAADVKATLARLSQIADSDTDMYLTSSPYRGEAPSRIHLSQLRPDNIQYLAGQNAGELLVQFDTLRAGQEYDAIFVITDGSGYELGESNLNVPIPKAPVWVIHLGGGMPLGYDDGTLAAIQASGGGVTGDIEDALNRLAISRSSQSFAPADIPAGAMADWSDGYMWFTSAGSATSGNLAGTADDGFAALAARRLILGETQRQRATLASTSVLDQLHAVAVKYGVVTPYSSMIVLVNSRQEQLLNQLEESSDRFSREVEGVGNTLAANPLAVTGVPEPGEWILLGAAVALLMGYAYIKRRQPQLG